MSLDTVAEDIRAQAQAEAEEIVQTAEQEAETLREQAETEASEIQEQRLAEAENTIEQEREQELSSASLEAKQLRLEARRDALTRVRTDIETELENIDGEKRRTLTKQLLDNTIAEFDDGPIEIYCRADDRELLEQLAERYDDKELRYAGEADCLGGVVAESDSSQVRVTNTFDAVLADVWDENLRETADRLFD
jgi:Archaeal/vacuolar-type H+-ATPase subunit E